MRGDAGCILPLNSGKTQCFGLAFHTMVTLRVSYYAPPDMGHRICKSLRLNSCGKTSCRKKLGSTDSHWFSSYRGKDPRKPKRFSWSVQGGLGGNRNPPRLFFFCQRFLLEKQKKMLDRTCKFAAVSRILFQKLRLSF